MTSIFYGWVIVCAAGALYLCSAPGHTTVRLDGETDLARDKLKVQCSAGQIVHSTFFSSTQGVNQFVESWLSDLSISRSVLAAIWTGASFSSALLIPFYGNVLDKFGSRRSLAVLTILYIGCLFFLSFVDSAPALAIGLALLRFFGPECLILTASFTINKWWAKKRGFSTLS